MIKTNGTNSRVALLGLASLAREDDKAGLVRLQALNIDRFAFLAQIPAAVVYNNADAECLLAADTSLLEFSQGETASLTDFAVVPDGGCTDSGAKEIERANTELSGLGYTSVTPAEFASGLVEPGPHPALPVLAEVVGVENCRDKSLEHISYVGL
jgi:hypothetical protein